MRRIFVHNHFEVDAAGRKYRVKLLAHRLRNEFIVLAHQNEQLAILDESKEIKSIVEWTPAQTLSPAVLQKDTKLQHRENAYNIPPARHHDDRKVPPKMNLREQVALSMSTLLMQLGVIYMPGTAEPVPKDYIFAKARKLGLQHPLNRTLGALLIANDQLGATDALPDSTLQLLQDARAEIIRHKSRPNARASLPLLNMLETNLQPIFRFLQEDRLIQN